MLRTLAFIQDQYPPPIYPSHYVVGSGVWYRLHFISGPVLVLKAEVPQFF
jgi:hypothetical protein